MQFFEMKNLSPLKGYCGSERPSQSGRSLAKLRERSHQRLEQLWDAKDSPENPSNVSKHILQRLLEDDKMKDAVHALLFAGILPGGPL